MLTDSDLVSVTAPGCQVCFSLKLNINISSEPLVLFRLWIILLLPSQTAECLIGCKREYSRVWWHLKKHIPQKYFLSGLHWNEVIYVGNNSLTTSSRPVPKLLGRVTTGRPGQVWSTSFYQQTRRERSECLNGKQFGVESFL